MNRLIIYGFGFLTIFTGCEQIYTPGVDSVENVMVVEARLEAEKTVNYVRLYKSRGYNDAGYNYENISGAEVWLDDNKGNEKELDELNDGYFRLNYNLNPEQEYKIRIEYFGNTYESSFEPVPPIPDIDTVYGIPETKLLKESGDNNAGDIKEIEGVQLYADIIHEKEMPYYKFTARKVFQFTYTINLPPPESVYEWFSVYPRGLYNIAAPAEYSASKDILKHPLYFMEQKVHLDSGQYNQGWILILHQYGLSKSIYNYYDDLNKQLDAEGKLFDPLYVQARNNIKCISDTKQLVLGSFEISSYREHRYYVKYISQKSGYYIRRIPYFYDIPVMGKDTIYPPDFWEYPGKYYPVE